jgi:hypothetical protein
MKDVILFNTHFITATKNKGFITYLVEARFIIFCGKTYKIWIGPDFFWQ